MEVRGRHQGNGSAHRVEADPAERPIPVDGRKLGDGVGVQDVDGRAERPGVHGGRLVPGDSRLRARVFSILRVAGRPLGAPIVPIVSLAYAPTLRTT